MVDPNVFERAKGARLNFDRASSFGSPVLRSLHPDAILVGYSVTAVDEVDRVVESNHVLRSTLEAPEPTSFTCRTFKSWSDADNEWLLHNLDHLMNTESQYREMSDPRVAGALS